MIQSLGTLPIFLASLLTLGMASIGPAQTPEKSSDNQGASSPAKRDFARFGTAQFRMPAKFNWGAALNAAESPPPSLFQPVSTLQIKVAQPPVFAENSGPILINRPESLASPGLEPMPAFDSIVEPPSASDLPVEVDNPGVLFTAPASSAEPYTGEVQFVDPLADPAKLMPSAGVQHESLPAPEPEPDLLPAPDVEPELLPALEGEPKLLPRLEAQPEMLPSLLKTADPLFDSLINEGFNEGDVHIVEGPFTTFSRVKEFICRPAGVGAERVVHAPFEVDTTQPQNYISVGTDLAYDFLHPNRAEYLIASPLNGPGPEDSADYQDFLFKVELGSKTFSLATEVPIRGIDPQINRNHAGLGDLKVTLKTVFLDGRTWQITPMLRTHVNTGNAKLGLGTGHLSLEPGVLFRYRVNDANYIHAALKYWFPIGGDAIHAGEVLSDGFAWSSVLRDRDSYALISSLEAVHWQIMDGQQTTSAGVSDIDPENIFTFYAGARIVRDTGSDLGLVEYGLQWGTAFGDARWYQNLLRASIRFSF